MHALNTAVKTAMLSLFLVQCSAASLNELNTNSGIGGRPYEAVIDELRRLQTANPNLFDLMEYGKSMGGKSLYMMKISDRSLSAASAGNARPAVLITEAIHGNEFLDVAQSVVDELTAETKKVGSPMRDYLARGGTVLFVPVMNPDGYEINQNLLSSGTAEQSGPDSGNNWGRTNLNKIDLNRDFPIPSQNFAGNTQPEVAQFNRKLSQEIASGYRLEFSLDYHCCVGDGGLIQPIGYSNLQLPAEQQQRYREYTSIYSAQLQNIQVGNPALVAGYTYETGNKEYYGMSADSFFDIYKSVSLVFEGAKTGETGRRDAHFRAFSQTLAKINAKYPTIQGSSSHTSGIKVLLAQGGGNQIKLVAIAGASSLTEIAVCEGNKLECSQANARIIGRVSPSSTSASIKFFAASNIFLTENKTYTFLCAGVSNSIKLVSK